MLQNHNAMCHLSNAIMCDRGIVLLQKFNYNVQDSHGSNAPEAYVNAPEALV